MRFPRVLGKIADLDLLQVEDLLGLAFEFRKRHEQGLRSGTELRGKVVAMVFEKPSLRTKIAFEVAAASLGATPVFLSSSQILASGNNQQGRESIPDIGRNLERFADLIMARVYRHETIQTLAKSVRIPVINALCDRHHPTQALADLMTIRLKKGHQTAIKVAFVGDGNNVATSLMQICALSGIDFAAASPPGFEIPAAERDRGRKFAAATGKSVEFFRSPVQAVNGADVVYTDTFVSMGQEAEREKRAAVFSDYQVGAELMKSAKPDAVFMHCLPAHRGEEVTDEVMDSPQSVVFDQAECRLHIAKALLLRMLAR